MVARSISHPTAFPFLSLPVEVRLRVYAFYHPFLTRKAANERFVDFHIQYTIHSNMDASLNTHMPYHQRSSLSLMRTCSTIVEAKGSLLHKPRYVFEISDREVDTLGIPCDVVGYLHVGAAIPPRSFVKTILRESPLMALDGRGGQGRRHSSDFDFIDEVFMCLKAINKSSGSIGDIVALEIVSKGQLIGLRRAVLENFFALRRNHALILEDL